MEVDVNKPVENPNLKNLLNKRLNRPQEEQISILNQIAQEITTNVHFLAVIHIDNSSIQHNPDGTATFTKDAEVSFPALNTMDGNHIQPLFTDWEELRKWEPFKTGEVSTIILSFDDVYSIVSRNQGTVVINPFGDSIVFPFDMLNHMKNVKESQNASVQQQVIQKDTQVMIGEPKKYPQQMVNAIISYANNVAEINAIWLKLMVKDGEQSFLLIVDADANPERYFQTIANAATPYLPKGMYIDMVPFNSDFGQSAATGEPVFKR